MVKSVPARVKCIATSVLAKWRGIDNDERNEGSEQTVFYLRCHAAGGRGNGI
jgi:hypothetical protein